MIKFRNLILENYFIDPATAVITNSKCEIQEIKIGKDGRPSFKGVGIHVWQVHTHVGYQRGMVIHHIDENKFNNSLSNLVYLTPSEHSKIHNKGENNVMFGKHHSEETRNKISDSLKGHKFSDETKQKMSDSHKGKKLSDEIKQKLSKSHKGLQCGERNPMYGKRYKWINNGVENRYIPFDEYIPEGFIKGRLKRKIS